MVSMFTNVLSRQQKKTNYGNIQNLPELQTNDKFVVTIWDQISSIWFTENI